MVDKRLTVKNAFRCIIGAGVVAAAYGAISVWMICQSEQRIAEEVVALGGHTGRDYAGPTWVPPSVRRKMRPWFRISKISLSSTRTTDSALSILPGARSLGVLYLYDASISDAGMLHLRGLDCLRILGLSRTRIGNAGLEQLASLTSLERLYLDSTAISDGGLRPSGAVRH